MTSEIDYDTLHNQVSLMETKLAELARYPLFERDDSIGDKFIHTKELSKLKYLKDFHI